VAAHLAAQGLGRGETAAALAGGVNVMLLAQTTARICLLQARSERSASCQTKTHGAFLHAHAHPLSVGYTAEASHDISIRPVGRLNAA
jgi:hypothetical protein